MEQPPATRRDDRKERDEADQSCHLRPDDLKLKPVERREYRQAGNRNDDVARAAVKCGCQNSKARGNCRRVQYLNRRRAPTAQ